MSYLKQYKYVSAVVEYGTITQAAEKLGIAQSALSRYLIKLEKDLGTVLFDRNVEPIMLTQSGKVFLETGQEMLALDREMKRKIREAEGFGCIDIHVGIGPSRAPYILPAVLKNFRVRDNKTNIVIYELTTNEIKTRILKGELDMAISVIDDKLPSIEYIDLFKERILVCKNKKIKNNSPIYPGKGQLLRDIMDKIIADGNIRYTNCIEAQNTDTAIALVRAGLGFTVVPSYFEEFSFGDGLEYSEVEDCHDNNERTVYLLYRKDRILKKEEKQFTECAIKVLGD